MVDDSPTDVVIDVSQDIDARRSGGSARQAGRAASVPRVVVKICGGRKTSWLARSLAGVLRQQA